PITRSATGSVGFTFPPLSWCPHHMKDAMLLCRKLPRDHLRHDLKKDAKLLFVQHPFRRRAEFFQIFRLAAIFRENGIEEECSCRVGTVLIPPTLFFAREGMNESVVSAKFGLVLLPGAGNIDAKPASLFIQHKPWRRRVGVSRQVIHLEFVVEINESTILERGTETIVRSNKYAAKVNEMSVPYPENLFTVAPPPVPAATACTHKYIRVLPTGILLLLLYCFRDSPGGKDARGEPELIVPVPYTEIQVER
ncbi:MAG: hypothetical protein ABFD70_10315, partial [Syntrophaceae bacterium]